MQKLYLNSKTILVSSFDETTKTAIQRIMTQLPNGTWVEKDEYYSTDEESRKFREEENLTPRQEEELLNVSHEELTPDELARIDKLERVRVQNPKSLKFLEFDKAIKDKDISKEELRELADEYEIDNLNEFFEWQLSREEKNQTENDSLYTPLTKEELRSLYDEFGMPMEKLYQLGGVIPREEEDNDDDRILKQFDKYKNEINLNKEFQEQFNTWFQDSISKLEKKNGKKIPFKLKEKTKEKYKLKKLEERGIDPDSYLAWEESLKPTDEQMPINAFTYEGIIKLGFSKKLADALADLNPDEPAEILDTVSGETLPVTKTKGSEGEDVYLLGEEGDPNREAVKDDNQKVQELKNQGLPVKESNFNAWYKTLLD